MSDTANAIPRTWRILIYTTSILGFNNVTMCSWLPGKLRTTSVIYNGFMLLIYTINAIVFVIELRLDGALQSWTTRLMYFSIAICGLSICAINFCVNITKRPSICLQTWAKYSMQQNKTNTQAFILCTVPLVMATFAIISCFYTANTMFTYADILAESLLPFALGGKKVQHMIYVMMVIISDLIILATSFYAALVCSTMMEMYVCVTALHQDLLIVCTQQHVSDHELQTWRRKFRCQEKVLRSVNDYLGRSVLVVLIMCVSILILTIFRCIGEKAVNTSLMLFICNAVTLICGLTLPSAILNGKVGTNTMGIIYLILCAIH